MLVLKWKDFISEDFNFKSEGTALTIGSFDGPHRGHLEIFKKVLSVSKENSYASGIVTFSRPLPSIKHADSYSGDISSLDQRLSIFEELGIDLVLLIDFDESFAQIPGDTFLSMLKEKLSMKYLCEGVDFRCGHKGSFSKTEIENWGKENGIKTEFLTLVTEDGERISSSKIRNLLKSHKDAEAERLLGREHIPLKGEF